MYQNARPRFLPSASAVCLEDLTTSNSPRAVLSSFNFQAFPEMDTPHALFHLRQQTKSLTDLHFRLKACPSRTSTDETIEFTVRRTSIEQFVFLAGQSFAILHGSDRDARLREACCIAGSIYVRYVLRDFQRRPTDILEILKRRFMNCVERFELETFSQNRLPVSVSVAALFWALNLGAAMSLDMAERTWFVLRMSRCAKILELRSLEQVLSILNGFLWVEKLENEAWKEIWGELRESITGS